MFAAVERALGVIALLALLAGFSYIQYDYWTNVRPAALKMNEVIVRGKDDKGQPFQLKRHEVLDMVIMKTYQGDTK